MSETVHSHWHQSISGLTVDPKEFYERVAEAVDRKQIPGVKISGTYFSEGAIGSAQRLYLRVKRNEYFFDICGAPFADGSFVSWWLAEDAGCMRGCLLAIPVLGWLLLVLIFRETYYKVDSRLMFQGVVHSAVLEVVDAYTQAKGLRGLSELERQPTMQKLLK
jgi:hypothetical protein